MEVTILEDFWSKICNVFATKGQLAATAALKANVSTTLAGYGITDAYTKTEVNGLVGSGTQEQADWNQTDNTAVDYIKNKPTIPTVPTNVSSFTNDAGYLTSHQDISGKEDVTAIQAVASGSTLSAALNKYYRFDYNVGTLAITLPSVSGVTGLKGIVFSFTTGSSPAVTFTSTGGVSIDYQAYYAIIANTKYEINVLYNGSKWIINYAIID